MHTRITEKTAQQYNKRSIQVLSQYEKEMECDWRDNPPLFCDWILDKRSSWSRATWRLIKSAMIYYMTDNGPLEVVQRLQLASAHHSKATGRRTSQLKAKQVDMNEFIQIQHYLDDSNKKNDKLIGLWLWAGLTTGTRPCEWYRSTFNLETKTLTLKSAKVNEHRGSGEYRDLKFIDSADIVSINLVSEFVSEINRIAPTENDFNAIYEACRRRLYYVNKQMGNTGDHITLYSTRHQFMANAKSKHDSTEVAALVGHRSRFTAVREYLQRRFGNPDMVCVEPSSRNMLLVTDTHTVLDNDNSVAVNNSKDKVINS